MNIDLYPSEFGFMAEPKRAKFVIAVPHGPEINDENAAELGLVLARETGAALTVNTQLIRNLNERFEEIAVTGDCNRIHWYEEEKKYEEIIMHELQKKFLESIFALVKKSEHNFVLVLHTFKKRISPFLEDGKVRYMDMDVGTGVLLEKSGAYISPAEFYEKHQTTDTPGVITYPTECAEKFVKSVNANRLPDDFDRTTLGKRYQAYGKRMLIQYLAEKSIPAMQLEVRAQNLSSILARKHITLLLKDSLLKMMAKE